MKKYNEEMNKLKGLYMEPYTLLKAYVFAIILAVIITLPMYLIGLNLLYLYRYFNYVIFGLLLTSLLLVYLILYFKDKYIKAYVKDAENVNLFFIRIVDMSIVTIAILIIFGIYLLIF